MRKKTWNKPKLIVLLRGKPAENVLAGCKGASGTGPSDTNCFSSFGAPVCPLYAPPNAPNQYCSNPSAS